MVFTIRETDGSGSIIFQTSNTLLNNTSPSIFFDSSSFVKTDYPIWVQNNVINREGGISHYAGSNDSTMNVNLVLYGSDRKTNLDIIKRIKNKQIYLDAGDIDSNLTGKYVVIGFRTAYNEKKQYIKISMTWRIYNND